MVQKDTAVSTSRDLEEAEVQGDQRVSRRGKAPEYEDEVEPNLLQWDGLLLDAMPASMEKQTVIATSEDLEEDEVQRDKDLNGMLMLHPGGGAAHANGSCQLQCRRRQSHRPWQ